MKAKRLCQTIPLQTERLKELLERLKEQLQPQDYELIRSLAQTLEAILAFIVQTRMSIGRLRRLLFGAKTEKPNKNGKKNPPKSNKAGEPKNHGRNGTDKFPGARKVEVPHPTLKEGDVCQECDRGKLSLKEPVRLLHFIGQPLFVATIYLLERLRCNLCGAVFTAPAPPEAGLQKYDPTVGAMIGISRYQAGLPFNRVAQLQQSFGMPLAASTQWQIAKASAEELKPVYKQLIQEAAQARLVHNDDTHMKVLSLSQDIAKEQAESNSDSPQKPKRTGLFTSSVISVDQDHQIALFKTGREHAGENLEKVLEHRASELPPPIQMCDALISNYPKNFVTIIANCIPHGRRGFVDVFDSFPEPCRRVLDDLAQVFKFEAETKGMSVEQRLAYHQANSQPVMDQLHQWLQDQFDQKLVEPNSGLGQAIKYMLKHWQPLTLFLRHPGAPLSNNICERALKMAIRHRKNSLFYKTKEGAEVGDIFMSLIHTCQLNQVDPFQYLTALLSHPQQLAAAPAQWLPWSFRQTLQPSDTG